MAHVAGLAGFNQRAGVSGSTPVAFDPSSAEGLESLITRRGSLASPTVQAQEGGGVITGGGVTTILEPGGDIFQSGKDGKKERVRANVGFITSTKEDKVGQVIEDKVGGLRNETEGLLVEESVNQIKDIRTESAQKRQQIGAQIRQDRNEQSNLVRTRSQMLKQAKRFRFEARVIGDQSARSRLVKKARLNRMAEELEARSAELSQAIDVRLGGRIRQAQVSLNDTFTQRTEATNQVVRDASLGIRAKRAKDAESKSGPKVSAAISKQLTFLNKDLAKASTALNTRLKEFNDNFRKQGIEARVDPADPTQIEVVDIKTQEVKDTFKGAAAVSFIKRLRASQAKFTKLTEQVDRFRIMIFGEPPDNVTLTGWLDMVREVRDRHGLSTQETVEILREQARQLTAEQQALEATTAMEGPRR